MRGLIFQFMILFIRKSNYFFIQYNSSRLVTIVAGEVVELFVFYVTFYQADKCRKLCNEIRMLDLSCN